MLKEKVRSAKFVRCISEHGRNKLLQIVGEQYKEKVKIIHMGVKIPSLPADKKKINISEKLTIITPANLCDVKGHKYLIEACSVLVKKNLRNFQCYFYGEGPLGAKLASLIKEKGLHDYIQMPGVIPHGKLMGIYKNNKADLIVLPSILTREGDHEGIPVSLMEGMAYKIPVISTNTGGIPELLSNGAGIVVEEKSAKQLAEAISNILENLELKNELQNNGYQRVSQEFNITAVVAELLKNIGIT